jgi:uncharacterized protein YnzC (UPF0291/DUF896 family)
MITKELLQRINELARKKRSEGLTSAEQAEQAKLYKIYLASIKEQVTTQLDAAGANPKGSQEHGCHDSCCENHQHGPGCNHGKH